jgi:hypothetical protein
MLESQLRERERERERERGMRRVQLFVLIVPITYMKSGQQRKVLGRKAQERLPKE